MGSVRRLRALGDAELSAVMVVGEIDGSVIAQRVTQPPNDAPRRLWPLRVFWEEFPFRQFHFHRRHSFRDFRHAIMMIPASQHRPARGRGGRSIEQRVWFLGRSTGMRSSERLRIHDSISAGYLAAAGIISILFMTWA